MGRLKAVWAALVALLTVGACVASAASATEWQINGEPFVESTEVLSHFAVELNDMKGGALGGSVTIACEGYMSGTIEPGSTMVVEEVYELIEPGVKSSNIKCEHTAGESCGSPKAEMIDLPWALALKETGGEIRGLLEEDGNGTPGSRFECGVLLTAVDECVGMMSIGFAAPTAEGIEGVFDAVSNEEPRNCTRGGTDEGLVAGGVLFLLEGLEVK